MQVYTPEALLKKAISLVPSHGPSLLKLAEIHIKNKKLESANHYLRSLIDRGMGNELAYYYLAQISVQQKDWKQAAKYIQESLRFNPQNYDCLTLALLIYQKIGDQNQVVQKLETIISLFPNNSKCFYKLSNALKTEDLYHRKVFLMEEAYSLENKNLSYIKELLCLYADSYKYSFLKLRDMDEVFKRGSSICNIIENVETPNEVIESCLLFLFYTEQHNKIIRWYENQNVLSSSCLSVESNFIIARTYSILHNNSNSIKIFTAISSTNKYDVVNIHYYRELVYGEINKLSNFRRLIKCTNLVLDKIHERMKSHLEKNDLLDAKMLLWDYKLYSSFSDEFSNLMGKIKSS